MVRHRPGCTFIKMEILHKGSQGILSTVYVAKTKELISCMVTMQKGENFLFCCIASSSDDHSGGISIWLRHPNGQKGVDQVANHYCFEAPEPAEGCPKINSICNQFQQ